MGCSNSTGTIYQGTWTVNIPFDAMERMTSDPKRVMEIHEGADTDDPLKSVEHGVDGPLSMLYHHAMHSHYDVFRLVSSGFEKVEHSGILYYVDKPDLSCDECRRQATHQIHIRAIATGKSSDRCEYTYIVENLTGPMARLHKPVVKSGCAWALPIMMSNMQQKWPAALEAEKHAALALSSST
jgi:hypothetical protein